MITYRQLAAFVQSLGLMIFPLRVCYTFQPAREDDLESFFSFFSCSSINRLRITLYWVNSHVHDKVISSTTCAERRTPHFFNFFLFWVKRFNNYYTNLRHVCTIESSRLNWYSFEISFKFRLYCVWTVNGAYSGTRKNRRK